MPNAFSVLDQHDFTAGELDPTVKRRDDDPFVRKGARQLANGRTLNSGGVTNRPGRNALQALAGAGRVEEVLMAPGVKYRLAFTANTLKIFNAAGAQVFTEAARAWTAANVGQIRFAVYLKQVFLTFPGVVPEVLSWDGATTWTSASYAEAVFGSSQKRTPFYRIAPQGITLKPSAINGTVSLVFQGGNVLVSGMIGTRIRFCERQLQIASVSDGLNGTATVIEPLPPGMTLTTSGTVGRFNVGDVVIGATSNAEGIVTTTPTSQLIDFPVGANIAVSEFLVGDVVSGATSGATGIVNGISTTPVSSVGPMVIIQIGVALSGGTFTTGETITGPHTVSHTNSNVSGAVLTVQIVQNAAGLAATFVAETIAGPSGTATLSAVAVAAPQAVTVWDQEVMNSYQGWPSSVFVDQNRLGFCNFPSVPGGIAWSAIGIVTDLFPGANPTDAMFELAPGKSQVQDVLAGPESSEFVFTDVAVYYIPISQTNPLKPGSVAFQVISSDGAGTVQPRRVGEILMFADQGLTQLYSIVAVGAYTRPYETRPLTDLHAHLFNGIVAIALPTSVTQFPERYVYVLNGDGTIAVGKYVLDEGGKLAGRIGWVPWSGSGTVKWASALNDVVLFVTSYTAGAVIAVMLEQLDATRYLDASIAINAVPTALTPPGGKGPLWWLPSTTVDLMDGRFPLGPHTIDGNGFVLVNQPGEDLTSLTLRAGFAWTAVWEPFLPPVQGGADSGQRMKKRRCARFEVYVSDSSGFAVRQIYTGQQGPSLPALGTYIGGHRIAAYNQDDDATKAPPLREQGYTFRPRGRAHDPRHAVVKDTPGPLTVVEISTRISV